METGSKTMPRSEIRKEHGVLSGKDAIKGMPKSQTTHPETRDPKDCNSVLDGRACIERAPQADENRGGERRLKVQDLMTCDVAFVAPSGTIAEAAEAMYRLDVGCLPVAENDRLIGMITDRDIAVRGVAAGCGPDTPVKSVMTSEVCYCFEDQDLAEIAANMAEIQVRRLPVMNRDKKLVGIISIGDIATSQTTAAEALSGIVIPSSQHNQSGADGPYYTL
jgi:CBS domain-containing protein